MSAWPEVSRREPVDQGKRGHRSQRVARVQLSLTEPPLVIGSRGPIARGSGECGFGTVLLRQLESLDPIVVGLVELVCHRQGVDRREPRLGRVGRLAYQRAIADCGSGELDRPRRILPAGRQAPRELARDQPTSVRVAGRSVTDERLAC